MVTIGSGRRTTGANGQEERRAIAIAGARKDRSVRRGEGMKAIAIAGVEKRREDTSDGHRSSDCDRQDAQEEGVGVSHQAGTSSKW